MEQFNTEFNDIINNSKYFMMNQLSDIIDENKFHHVSFIGKTLISDIMNQDMTLAIRQNIVVNNNYRQFFITQKIYDEYKNVFNKDNSLTILNSYDDLFSGFIRVENYYILVNSLNKRLNVYILIDNNNSEQPLFNDENLEIEFYGFVKIGYLINQRAYNLEEITDFENKINFQLSDNMKNYLLNSSIVKFENKLFHIDLKNLSNNELHDVSQKYGYNGEKIVSNIKFLNKYRNGINEMTQEDEYMSKLKHGFLKIGLLKSNKILLSDDEKYDKNYVEIYLLINYETCLNVNYDCTLWTFTYDNKNFDDLLNNIQDDNLDVLKRDNIFRTLKCSGNLY